MNESLKTDRAYVFDFGRVVFRWRPEILVATALPARATDDEQARHWAAQIFQAYEGDWQHFDRGTVEADELARRIARRTGLSEAEVTAVIEGGTAELEPLPDTVAWLRRLHAQGRPLHYLSNMPEPFAAHFERTHDFMGHFESGVFSARAKLVKPEPEIFAHAAQVYGRAPGALLLVDDHLPNIVAARAAGWQAVHFVDAAQAERDAAALGW
jgi:putative hydrolase of the HAD superfamily